MWSVVELAGDLIDAQLNSMSPSGPSAVAILASLAVSVVVSIPVEAILWAAAFRAFLRPGLAQFAYIRLGSAELRLTRLVLLADVSGLVLIALLTAFPMLLILWRASPMWIVKYHLVVLTSDLATLLGTFALVRLMLTPAILIDQSRVSLSDSWRLTRSIFWSLAIPLLAWQILLMAFRWLAGSFIHAASDLAAARGHDWLTSSHLRGATTAVFPAWVSIPGLALMTTGAALEALSFVVIAGIATTAYRYVIAGAEPTNHEQPA